jgi:hypothetical protein
MVTIKVRITVIALLTFLPLCSVQAHQKHAADDEFGPVVRAYLGYLRDEQEVVDDRVSRREISATYYRRNSNRIKALRQTAIRLARESHNDYLPELEAVANSEFRLLFEHPPVVANLKVGEVIANKFRYLGSVRSVEMFYVFARLDPYEQSDLEKSSSKASASTDPADPKAATRTRRIGP